jgi:hypothetical protein
MHADSFQRIDARGDVLTLPSDCEARREALLQSEALHRAFRPNLGADYEKQLEVMFGEGARLLQMFDQGEVRALAVWRTFHTTYCGHRLEIDDLVTDEAHRSKGYGAAILRRLEAIGRERSCPTLTLVSATHRTRAHRFYYREGYAALAFYFSKDL